MDLNQIFFALMSIFFLIFALVLNLKNNFLNLILFLFFSLCFGVFTGFALLDYVIPRISPSVHDLSNLSLEEKITGKGIATTVYRGYLAVFALMGLALTFVLHKFVKNT